MILRTTDGFEISEADLKLRGAGDFFGTRQSGMPELRIADISEDMPILEQAQEAVRRIWEQDHDLIRPEYQVMRTYFETFVLARMEGYERTG